ncbi:MAG: hypothetical protein D6705_02005 [Deltaproteobacteria bacterium]|nr:MAG: hypothetical protein D6705_02005 [Deltaproteobacteria bacterium]
MPTPSPTPTSGAASGPVRKGILRREDPEALGLLRILLVAVFTASMLTHVGAVAEYFSDASPLYGDYARRAFPSRFSLFFYVRDPWAVRIVYAAGVLAHLAWLVGLFTEVAAAAAVLVWISMVGRNPLLYSLPDQLHTALALLLAAMPSGRGLSLDARLRGKRRPVPVWCRWIVQLQMGVLYTATGLLKTGKPWHGDGTAIYYALVNPYNRHFDLAPWLARIQPWILRPATYLVLMWEIVFGAFVVQNWVREAWRRRLRGSVGRWLAVDLRPVFLGFGVLMHLSIQFMLYVAFFTPLCIASYAAFLEPDEVRRLLARCRRR